MERKQTNDVRTQYSPKIEELLGRMSVSLSEILKDRPLVSSSQEALEYAQCLRDRVSRGVDPLFDYLARQSQNYGSSEGKDLINEILPMTSEVSSLDVKLRDSSDFQSFSVQSSYQGAIDEMSRFVRYLQSVKGGNE